MWSDYNRRYGVQSSNEQPSAIGQALLALGDQWAMLILQRAFLKRTRRFAEWRDELGMSESVLSGRLKEMVRGDLLEPSPYRQGRTRHEYLLTERALELWPLLVAVWSWEQTWVGRPTSLPDLVHNVCGEPTDTDLGCGACGKTPLTARDTETVRGAATTFAQVAVARHHRRTVRDRTPQDPLSYFPETLEILGDRWSTVILAAAFLRVRRFADFQSELGVAPSILSERLRRFTELGVFKQRDVSQARHEYRLTEKGVAFFPVFAFLTDWAQRWYTGPADSTITVIHRACGLPLIPSLHCRVCRGVLTRREIHFDLTATNPRPPRLPAH
jgi:DNA-binding HxlR family transcriptional regulator